MNGQDLTLDDEQQWLDEAYGHLTTMQRRAAEVRAISDRAVRDEDTVDARIAQYHLNRREVALREGSGPLCFGRIDTDDRNRWYIGRRHVEDDKASPVVVDWRAPVSAAFYRATGIDPCGLVFRRRFVVEDRRIEALLDEDLTDPESGSHGGLPDPLLAELGRSRHGQMSDIVATIAAEQDLIIRAPLDELLVVQGGPGTGKTAVGLHRAAFLLFEHRHALAESKVLVVGPNPLFLRYIAEVLPSLGETAVTQATLSGLVASRYRVRGQDDDELARLKGRIEMASIVHNVVRAQLKAQELELRAGLVVVRLSLDEVEQLQKTVLSRRLPVNDGRDVFRRLLIQEGWRRHCERPGVDPAGEPLFSSTVRGDAGFKAAVDKMWPTVSPVNLVRSLYRSPKWLIEAATGILSAEEQKKLKRPSTKKPADEVWTVGDLPLLDEAQWLCAGVPATYGHVVVDEAQDLSPMALRMLARRAAGGSMTVLGDLAQATSPHAVGSWRAALAAMTDHLAETSSSKRAVTVRQAELTVGYRVPAAILDIANRLLTEAAPEVTPAQSVRQGGDPPLVVRVEAGDIEATVAAEVKALYQRTASVAVVALEHRLDGLAAALQAAGLPSDRVGGAGLPGHEAVALVDPPTVKGLEFDAVVVVEPGEIAATDSGLRHLYVAMTRAVQHLGLIHAEPLPTLLEL
ncbi:MAG: AAA family ATPase [Actinomycetia bacterium]|nr:AAA family ATPase [Actinomycetes bacterium]MCP5032123.1 AAA family ATPase [Actinomycetes bacterium]